VQVGFWGSSSMIWDLFTRYIVIVGTLIDRISDFMSMRVCTDLRILGSMICIAVRVIFCAIECQSIICGAEHVKPSW